MGLLVLRIPPYGLGWTFRFNAQSSTVPSGIPGRKLQYFDDILQPLLRLQIDRTVANGIFGGEDEIRTILVDCSRAADLLDSCVRGISRGQRSDPSATAFCTDLFRGAFPVCWKENGIVQSFRRWH